MAIKFCTLANLFRLALENVGLAISAESLKGDSPCSEPFATFLCNTKVLDLLKSHSIVPFSDMSLRDTTYQGCWQFDKTKEGGYNFRLKLGVSVHFIPINRGIELVPTVSGTFPCKSNERADSRLFGILVGKFPDKVPPIAHRLLLGPTTVCWSELGLGGLRSLGDLFRERFEEYSNYGEILRIARRGKVFDPNPVPISLDETISLWEERFVREPDHRLLFDRWGEQLVRFGEGLVRAGRG